LEKNGFQVVAPQMPNAMFPKLDEWLMTLQELIVQPDKDTYLVGHSLGCYTILKYLEQLPRDTFVGGVVMVAGFAGNLKHNIPVLAKFYESGLDWPLVKSHCSKFVAIGSEKDDYVHIQSLHEFEEKLGAKTIINNDWEHFSGAEGIKELPDVLNSLLEMTQPN
jgi:predicted alpha/beta hydrolase family esterase